MNGQVGHPLTLTPPMVRLSTDDLPTVDEDGGELLIGQEMLVEDTGGRVYWTGEAWAAVTVAQKIDQMCEFLRDIRDALVKEDD